MVPRDVALDVMYRNRDALSNALAEEAAARCYAAMASTAEERGCWEAVADEAADEASRVLAEDEMIREMLELV